jgi:glycosyltransferase involved in cell wall biosynthesis
VDATILVPLRAGADRALRCFQALAALPPQPSFRAVVIDDAAPDLGAVLAMLEGDVDVVRRERPGGVATAAQAGLAHAAGDIVVLLRDAGEVQGDWLAPLVRELDDPAVAAAASVHHDNPDATPAVGAPALAWRRGDVTTIPAASDDLVVAALCAELARTGEVRPVAASAVLPADARGAAARGLAYGAQPELSVVIPTIDAAGDRLRRCVAAVQAGTDVAHEIIVVDNGSPPQGFTAPVNSGLRAARGAFMVVCNDDVEVQRGWWAPLRGALEAGAAVAFPRTLEGATRHDFAAWCFALSRTTLETHAVAPGEFLDPAMVVWYQDTDLLQRLRVAGTPPVYVAESTIRHGLSETVGTEDPELRAWIGAQVGRDKTVFEAKHGTAVPGAAR